MGHKVFNNRHLQWIWIFSEIGCVIVTTVVLLGVHYGAHARNAPVQPQELWKYAYLHKEHQILEDWAIILTVVISIFVVVPFLMALMYVKKWSWANLGDDALVFFFAYFNGNILCLVVIEIFKRAVGRPRPDFLSRCLNTVDPLEIKKYMDSHPVGGQIKCVVPETDSLIKDGRMSFPSGHSAGSCFAYIFIALWIFERMGPYRRIGFARLLLPLYVVVFPLMVMVTRVMDNRHNPLDVVSGGIIGTILAILTYKFYYPLHVKPLVRPPSWSESEAAFDTQQLNSQDYTIKVDPHSVKTHVDGRSMSHDQTTGGDYRDL